MRPLLLLLLAGCVDHDLCAGHDGTCIGLTVAGSGSVDQLRIQMSGAAHLDGHTPPAPSAPHKLPVSTALFLPRVGGAVDLQVEGLLGGALVGAGFATAVVRPGQHQNLALTISPGPLPDLETRDHSGEDLTSFADLAGADLTGADLTGAPPPDLLSPLPDLSTPDLAGSVPRFVFLLTARSSALGSHLTVDGYCTTEALAAGLPPGTYKAVIAYPPSDQPLSYIQLTEHRPVTLPGGTLVSNDDDFFDSAINHLAAIDQLANGTTVVSGCAFSSFDRNGGRINSPSDCVGWSDATSAFNGITGDVKASDTNWSFQTPIESCDLLTCHVYCIQQ